MKARRYLLPVLAALALLWAGLTSAPARAQQVVADLSQHLVGITTGFVGTDVLLFGAVEGKGDVVVIVRGPARREVVRRKARVGGIWVNVDELAFTNAPSFYAVAASRPVEEVLSARLRARHRIGTEFLDLRAARQAEPEILAAFRAGLMRNKAKKGLYLDVPGRVNFLGNRLFRTTLSFPANVPTGTYTVEVLLVRNGGVVSAQTSPLLISKIGVGADVYRFANNYAMLYGIIAILIALAAGWIAAAAFRKS